MITIIAVLLLLLGLLLRRFFKLLKRPNLSVYNFIESRRKSKSKDITVHIIELHTFSNCEIAEKMIEKGINLTKNDILQILSAYQQFASSVTTATNDHTTPCIILYPDKDPNHRLQEIQTISVFRWF